MEVVKYSAVPIVQQNGNASNPSLVKGVVESNRPVQSIGAVDYRQGFSGGKDRLPGDITITFDNVAGPGTKVFVFGDSYGLVAGITGATYVKPTIKNSNYDAVVNAMAVNARSYKSLNYRVITGTPAQFSEKFQYVDADEDGSVQFIPINMGSAQRNTQQNDKILTLGVDFFMDGSNAILLTVPAGVLVEIDLSLRALVRSGLDL